MGEVGFAVQLKQTAPGAWNWAVLDEDGNEAATGKSLNETIARQEAELFWQSLTRFRSVTKGW